MPLFPNTPDASTTIKGKVQLAGDLGGTADLPTVLQITKNPYKFSAYRNAAQNSGNAAFAIINFDTEDFDTGSNFDVATNVGRFTAPVAGFYQFNARAAASATSQFLIALYKNGAILQRGGHSLGNGVYGVTMSQIVQAAVNDYFEIYSFCSGGALEVATKGIYFSGFLVSLT